MTTLLVSGSRSIVDIRWVYSCIDEMKPFDKIIHGGARGVDSIANKYCVEREIPCEIFSPDYDTFGKTAPLLRNTVMLRKATKVLILWDGVSSGTADVLRKTKALGKPFVLKKMRDQPLDVWKK